MQTKRQIIYGLTNQSTLKSTGYQLSQIYRTVADGIFSCVCTYRSARWLAKSDLCIEEIDRLYTEGQIVIETICCVGGTNQCGYVLLLSTIWLTYH